MAMEGKWPELPEWNPGRGISLVEVLAVDTTDDRYGVVDRFGVVRLLVRVVKSSSTRAAIGTKGFSLKEEDLPWVVVWVVVKKLAYDLLRKTLQLKEQNRPGDNLAVEVEGLEVRLPARTPRSVDEILKETPPLTTQEITARLEDLKEGS